MVRGMRGRIRPRKALRGMGFVNRTTRTGPELYASALVHVLWPKGSPKRIRAPSSPVHSEPPSVPPNGPRGCIGIRGPDRGSSLLERKPGNA